MLFLYVPINFKSASRSWKNSEKKNEHMSWGIGEDFSLILLHLYQIQKPVEEEKLNLITMVQVLWMDFEVWSLRKEVGVGSIKI